MTTSATAAEAHFRAVAPIYMRLLLADFPQLGPEDAAAVFGNAGHESKGLTDDQEDAPVVKGSRGGRNWMQWTGPRRVALEAYCKRNKLDPDSDIAAYKWLFLELKGSEKKAIPALLKATTLEDKVVAFEKAYLRAGVKHYPSRQKWAQIALDALGKSDTKSEAVAPAAPAPRTQPGWMPLAIIAVLSLLVGAAVWIMGGQAPVSEVSLLGRAPVPHPRPFGLLGGERSLWSDIALQIVLAFVAPLVSAAATAAVGWIVYWWGRVLKADFDAQSADALHAALERAGLAVVEALGTRASKARKLAFMADYVAEHNGDAVKHFRLGKDALEQLAVSHLVSARGAR